MNEVQHLSNDLNVITAEINSYKQVAGQAIFEIGKRLKHVKENDLAHGEWESYCLETLEMSRGHANKYIRVFEEFGKDNVLPGIGLKKLYQIATLPEEERKKEHKVNGENKKVDEMTSRELEQLKRDLKQEKQAKQQAEKQAEQAKKSEEIALRKLEDEQSKEPEVIEKEVIKEVDKTDYERIKKLERQIKSMKLSNEDFSQKEKEVKLLQLDASKSVLNTKIKIDEFLQEVAVTSYRRGAIATSSDGTKRKLREGIDDLKNFIKEMELALDGTIEH